jgi:hypothetical protein
MKLSYFLFFLTIFFTLVACGGGGGGGDVDNTASKVNTNTVQNESADGVWRGYTTNNFGQTSLTLGIFYNGDFVAINDDFQEFYSGSYITKQNGFTSVDTKGYYWNGPYIGQGVIDGVVTSKGSMSLDFASESGITGIIDLGYESSISNADVTYADLSGAWVGSDDSIGLYYAIVIDEQGNFAADSSDGCQVAGTLSIPDTNLNLFELILSISGYRCTVTGNYTGFGVLYEGEISIAYSNDNYGFAYDAVRLGQ